MPNLMGQTPMKPLQTLSPDGLMAKNPQGGSPCPPSICLKLHYRTLPDAYGRIRTSKPPPPGSVGSLPRSHVVPSANHWILEIWRFFGTWNFSFIPLVLGPRDKTSDKNPNPAGTPENQ